MDDIQHKKKKAAYHKAWAARPANKKKLAAYYEVYCEVNKEEIAAQRKAYRHANKEEKAAYDRVYRETEKEAITVRQKAYYEGRRQEIRERTSAYYYANKEAIAITVKAYKLAHKEDLAPGLAARQSKRRALKRNAVLPTTDQELIKNFFKQRVDMTEKHGELYHVDHIIPLSIGGAHHQDNLRVITAEENREKHNKYIPELGGVWADNDLAREYKKKHGIG